MIKYDLKCIECQHQFEGWFSDSAGFDEQLGANEVLCPVCSSPNVGKAIMAPNISTGRASRADVPKEQSQAEVRHMFAQLRQHIEANCEYVGQHFGVPWISIYITILIVYCYQN